jgi:hypothetical protein
MTTIYSWLDADTVKNFLLPGDSKWHVQPETESSLTRRIGVVNYQDRGEFFALTPFLPETPRIELFTVHYAGKSAEELAMEVQTKLAETQHSHIFHIFVFPEYARVGDRVVYYDEDGYSSAKPNGTLGVVVDYEYAVQPRTYTLPADLAGAELGYYKKAVNIMVKWDGDVEATDVSASHCGPAKDAKYVMSVRRDDPATKLLSLGNFVAPLETPRLKKHDRFRFPLIGDRWFDLERHQKTVEVTHVSWRHGEGVFYAVSGIGDDTRTYYGSVKESDLADPPQGLARGNTYYYENGEFDKMKFDSIADEIRYYVGVEKIEQIKCPNTGNYGWDFDSFEDALAAGKPYFARPNNLGGLFGATQNTRRLASVYAIPDTFPHLQAHCRAEYLRETHHAKLGAITKINHVRVFDDEFKYWTASRDATKPPVSVKYAEYLYSYTRKVDGKNCLVIVIKDDTSRRSRNLVMFIKGKEEVKLIMHELRRYNRVTLNKLDIPRGTESE